MDSQIYLFLANILIWVGLGGYVLLVGREQQRLDRRMQQVEAMLDES